MPTLQLQEFNMHYAMQGSGRTPIIFIHGNFSNWQYWESFLQSPLGGYTAYAVDLRGCGNSGAPESGYDIRTMSHDILLLADYLKLKKFHLVGHSLGGAIAQQLAGTVPGRIITLTLVAPAPAEGFSMNLINTLISRIFPPPKTLRRLNKYGLKRATLANGLKKSMPSIKKQTALVAQLADIAYQMDVKAISGFWETLKEWTGEQLLTNFTFPVLIIHGDLDPIIKRSPLLKMEKAINNCVLVKWPKIGHAPQIEAADKFNSLLNDFFKGKAILSTPSLTFVQKLKAFFKTLAQKFK
ncbi:MAG: hypothetical protein A6F71_02245 [Cycloclasticus sp. symbiont of Poecilosclerida sp. M]|nr:MAG: hypothetical protein A6F71_02245 [Cycloclasticus sp. symbiont of Poecilosclerida sp. M]